MPEKYTKLDKPSARLRVNALLPKGGGFGLRLKTGIDQLEIDQLAGAAHPCRDPIDRGVAATAKARALAVARGVRSRLVRERRRRRPPWQNARARAFLRSTSCSRGCVR